METDSEISATQSSVASGRSTRQTEDDLAMEISINGVNGVNGHHHEDAVDDSPREITSDRYETLILIR